MWLRYQWINWGMENPVRISEIISTESEFQGEIKKQSILRVLVVYLHSDIKEVFKNTWNYFFKTLLIILHYSLYENQKGKYHKNILKIDEEPYKSMNIIMIIVTMIVVVT